MIQMTLLQDPNPFLPILDEIAKRGDNLAPIPVANAYELDPDSGLWLWTVDVDVRIRNRISLDFVTTASTLGEAISKAVNRLRHELPKC